MRLHFLERGQGPPVVLLHGLFGSLDNWTPVARRLEGFFRVIAIDLRNHGRSPHSAEMDYDLMADDVRGWIDAHAHGPVSVVGHSMGGKVAMRLALSHPDRVARLVAADIAPRAYEPSLGWLFDAMRAVNVKEAGTLRDVDEQLAPRVADVSVRRFLLKGVERDAGGGFRWKFNLESLCRNYPSLIAGVAEPGVAVYHGPALFIRGGRSDYVMEPDIEEIARLFPSFEIRTLPDAGHWVHADAAEAFVSLTEAFLKNRLPRDDSRCDRGEFF